MKYFTARKTKQLCHIFFSAKRKKTLPAWLSMRLKQRVWYVLSTFPNEFQRVMNLFVWIKPSCNMLHQRNFNRIQRISQRLQLNKQSNFNYIRKRDFADNWSEGESYKEEIEWLDWESSTSHIGLGSWIEQRHGPWSDWKTVKSARHTRGEIFNQIS